MWEYENVLRGRKRTNVVKQRLRMCVRGRKKRRGKEEHVLCVRSWGKLSMRMCEEEIQGL